MSKRTRCGTAAALAAAIVLTGCTSHPPSNPQPFFDRAVVSDNEVKLHDAVMAFFVGPQNSEMYTAVGEVHKPGYMVLVNTDGSVRAVKTKRMDMMRPVWSEHGLYFADESNDYYLTASGLAKAESPKSTAQNLMFALPAGGSVGIYNAGHSADGGYNNQVAATTNGTVRRYNVQGNYFTGAQCDDQIFGLTNRPGTHASKAPKRASMTSKVDPAASPQMLARLYPAEGKEKAVAWRPQFGSGTPPGQVPCRNGVITYLSWDNDANGREQPRIVSWDTVTGDYQAHPLTFDDATKLDPEEFGGVVQDLQNGQLHWVYADGRVFSTDTTTGKTTLLFNTELGSDGGPRQTIYAFSGGQIHAISTVPGGHGHVSYTVFHRNDGAIVRQASLTIPHTEINVSYLNLSHMTIRPQK